MLRLINLELQKLLHNKTSRTLIIISFFLPFLILLVAALKINVFGFFTLKLGELGLFDFPIIWHVNTFFAAYFKIFFAIVVVSMIGNEYSNKTLKQNLIDGLSKKEFISSKFYTIVFFSLISTLLIGALSLSIGLYYDTSIQISKIFQGSSFLIAYFFKLLGFFSLCLCLAMLAKRSAFALAFLALLSIGEWFIYGILSWNLETATATKIHNLLPLQSMYKLIEQPLQRIAMLKLPEHQINLTYDYMVNFQEIIVVVLWIIIFICTAFKILQKRDL